MNSSISSFVVELDLLRILNMVVFNSSALIEPSLSKSSSRSRSPNASIYEKIIIKYFHQNDPKHTFSVLSSWFFNFPTILLSTFLIASAALSDFGKDSNSRNSTTFSTQNTNDLKQSGGSNQIETKQKLSTFCSDYLFWLYCINCNRRF